MSAHHPTTDAHPAAHPTHAPPARHAEGSVFGVAQAGVVVALLAIVAGGELKLSAATAHAEKARRLAYGADRHLVNALGGEAGHAAFVRPTRVRAWRVEPRQVEAGEPGVETLHGYAVLAGPVDLSSARQRGFSDAFKDVLFARTSNKRCGFNPGVVVRWEDGVHTLDVLLCFSCRDLQVMLDGRPAVTDPGVDVVLHDFTRARDALLAASLAVFPDDAALKALPPG